MRECGAAAVECGTSVPLFKKHWPWESGRKLPHSERALLHMLSNHWNFLPGFSKDWKKPNRLSAVRRSPSYNADAQINVQRANTAWFNQLPV